MAANSKWTGLARDAIIAIVGFLAGVFVTDYTDFRSKRRDAVQAEFQQIRTTSDEITKLLAGFAEVADGSRPKSSQDVSALRDKLLALKSQADDLSSRIPAARDDYTEYVDAMVKLEKAAETFGGPGDAKPLVLALDDYYTAEAQFRDAVVAEQNRYRMPFR